MNKALKNLSQCIVFLLASLLGSVAYAQSGVPSIPQIPAFLPLSHTVAPSAEAMPLDGVWNITAINKRIRIDRGRAYAVDSWLHLFVLQVQPNMVVAKDIVRIGPGEYTANDLPLMGPATYKATPSGTLDVTVQGALGPVKLVFAPIDLEDRRWFERDRDGEDSSDDDSDDDFEDDDYYEGDDTEDDESDYP